MLASFLVFAIAAQAEQPIAYVLNTNAETLSKIELNTGSVSNDILTVGSDVFCFPSQIVIRDTLGYVTVSGTGEIQVINLNSETTGRFIKTGASTNPFWTAFRDDRYLYVTLMLDNSLAKMDYQADTVVRKVTVGKSPAGMIIVGDKAYIAITGFDFGTFEYDDPGLVTVYDMAGDSVITQIEVGINPQFLALDNLGRVHVVCTGDYENIKGWVYIIDPLADVKGDSIYLGGTPGQISIGPDNIAYVASAGWQENGFVYTYNSITGELYHDSTNPIEVDLNCMTVSAYQDSTCFTGSFTNFVNIIDSGGSYQASYAVSDGPVHIDFSYAAGDVNGDFKVDMLDILDLIGWLYKSGIPPRWPRWRANANADTAYNMLDILCLIAYLYKEGPRPKPGPTWVW
jgi:YVTN family beta-propeller protein